MAQYDIYPTGAVTAYVNKVNSTLGVSAILDRQMGISEYSLSGIAFYINAIEDYINIHNVGTLENEIVSGYFTSLGYATTDETRSPYWTSKDGVVASVSGMWVQTADTLADKTHIQTITASSGTFYNTVFDRSVFSDPETSYFTTLTLASSGQILNVYSGCSMPTYLALPDVIPVTDPLVVQGEPTTYPYQIRDDYCGFRSVYTRRIVRRRNRTRPVITRNYGIVNGRFISKNLTYTSENDIFVSGNVYIYGNLVLDGSAVTLSKQLNESIFNMDTHSHDGSDSMVVAMSGVNSVVPPNKPFTINMSSGDINVDGILHTNGIGMSTNWEEVDVEGVDNARELRTYGDSLMVVDDTKMLEVGSRLSPVTVDPTTKPAGYTTMPYFPGGAGDEFGLFYFDPHDASGFVDGMLAFKVWPSNAYDSTAARTGRGNYVHNNGIASRGVFDKLSPSTRRLNTLDKFHRINNKVYFSMYEEYVSASDVCLTLYEMNTDRYYSKPVAAVEVNTSNSDMTFLTQFTMGDDLIMPYKIPASGVGVVVYNPIHAFPTMAYEGVVSSGFLWIPPSSFGATEVSGNLGTSSGRMITTSTAFNGGICYMIDKTIYDVTRREDHRTVFSDIGMSGDISMVVCGGKLWTGQSLQISYDTDGRQNVDWTLVSGLQEIHPDNTDPWVWSPVVHNGWIYALAPPDPYSEWIDDVFADKFMVNYNIPNGAKIVRRRVSETELADNFNTYNVR